MSFQRLLTQHTSEAMHVQGNDGQSNTSGKSLSTFRPNTVEATVFKIVDGRLHSGVLTAHSSKRFTLFAFPISLAEAALFGSPESSDTATPISSNATESSLRSKSSKHFSKENARIFGASKRTSRRLWSSSVVRTRPTFLPSLTKTEPAWPVLSGPLI